MRRIAVLMVVFFAGVSQAQVATSVTVLTASTEVCPVTKPNPEPAGSATDDLATNYDFDGSDQGISVDDPLNKVSWFFAGDAKAADAVAWWGVFGSNAGGANEIGYLSGADYAQPSSLCNHWKLVTVPGMTSKSGGGVFSPDVMIAPPNDSISNYIFNPTPNKANAAAPILTPNSGIPGINETVTGGFSFANGVSDSIVLFYAGSPSVQFSNNTLGLPTTSVSYVVAWRNPTPVGTTNDVSPTTYQILDRVDYSLDNSDTTFCPGNFPTICPPVPPPGWQATAPAPPLGGHFVWVTPVIGSDGFLYLFGTGKFRASNVYLARMPVASISSIGHCATPPCYFGQTAGFQVWTTGASTGSTPSWSPTPPSAAEISGASPLSFADDLTADVSQISVRFFNDIGSNGLWLMLETPVGNPAFDQRVIARWATAPTGPWSNAIVVFNFSSPSGSQNEALYCCQGAWTGRLDPSGLKIWQCLTPANGAPAQQIVECRDASAAQTSGSAGPPRYGFYSPFMLPYLTNVSTTVSGQTRTDTFTVNYLLSIFEPYNSVLMNATLQMTSPVSPARRRAARH